MGTLAINKLRKIFTQPAITCSKLTIETLEQVLHLFKVNYKKPERRH